MLTRRSNKILMGALIATSYFASLVLSVHAALPPSVTSLNPVKEGISTPLRIASDANGNFYLTDPRGGGILKYSGTLKLVQVIKTSKRPLGIAEFPQGKLLVSQGDFVSILDSSGSEIGRLGSGIGQFKLSNGIAVDGTGTIYVTDSLDNCVQVFAPDGSFKFRFGSKGNQPGQFSSPAGITYEKSTNQLAVADTLNGRIQFFDPSGGYQKSIGSLGSGPLQFTAPQGVAFEYDKPTNSLLTRMYVVDSFQSNLQMINPSGSGTFLSFIGNYGRAPGQLTNPSDVLFDRSSDKLIVVNSQGASLVLYGIDTELPAGGSLPTLTIDTPPTVSNSSSITLTGTVNPGSSLKVSTDSGALPGAVSSPTPSTWNVPITNLKPGVNLITVKATSGSGEYVTQTVAVCLVTSSPTITIDPVTTPTNISRQTIKGTKAIDDIVSMTTSTNAIAGVVTYPSSTTWESTVSGLEAGDNGITAIATSAGGISAVSTTIAFDSVPPLLSISALPDTSNAATPVQNITGSASDQNLDGVTINDIPASISGNFFSGAVTLVGGANDIIVKALDKAGNVTVATRKVFFRTVKPPVAVTSPSDGLRTKSIMLTVTGSTDSGNTVTVNGSPVAPDAAGWNAPLNLVAGMNTITLTAKDSVGETHSIKRTVIVGPSSPSLSLDTPSQDVATNAKSMTFSGAVDPGSTLSYAVNGSVSPLAAANGSFSFTVPFSSEGKYTVTVTAADASSNLSSVTRTIFYDTKPPSLSLNKISTVSADIISGSAESGAIISAEHKGNILKGAVSTNGVWSLDLTNTGYSAASLVVRATDAAGNNRTHSLFPLGDVDGSGGEPDMIDAIKLMRIAFGYDVPTPVEIERGDVAPFMNGKPQPDGVINGNDVIVVLRRIIGLATW